MANTWTYSTKGTGHEHRGSLALRWELDTSSAVDDCDSDDGRDQLEYWIRYLQNHHPEWI